MKTDPYYKIPESVVADIEEHSKALEDFHAGRMDPLQFKIARVARGIYEQRTLGTFMMRIRLAGGGFAGYQMKKIAQLCREYGNGTVHVTDRQDVQLHGVKLDDSTEIMRKLLEVGLTTKGGGGNTVRNVTACWAAGACKDEVYDVTPYAVAVTEYMINDPASYNMPRKYKIAFSGCGKDCAFATVNDLGLIATKKPGSEEIGFRAYVAGGLGAYSRVAEFFDEFVPVDEIGYMAEAVKRLFDKHGNRKNKHKARLRFVMERYGLERFKEIYQQELQDLKNKETIALDIRPIPAGSEQPAGDSQQVGGEDFLEWREKHTQPQKDDRFSLVEVGLPIGLISADKLEKLAELADRFAGGDVRTTHNQNLSLRWVDDPGQLYKELKSAGFDVNFGGSITDVVCCPGSSTCQLGLCLSRGLGKQVTKSLAEIDPKGDIRDAGIRISGCPNSCGQHPIGPIGLYGAVKRIDDHLAPFYKILLGGRTEEGKTALGKEMGTVPAKNVPALLADFVSGYKNERADHEDFYAFLNRYGKDRMSFLIEKYSNIPGYEEDRDYYVDFGATEDFSLAGRGVGECGAGVFDMIDTDIANAKKAIAEAESFDETCIDLFECLYNGAASAARALLVTRGVEAKNEREVFNFFEEKFIDKGLADKKFLDLFALTPKSIRDRGKNHFLTLLSELYDTVQSLYDNMDNSLKFQEKTGDTDQETLNQDRKFLDLRGTECPFNYVKTKLFMEEMEMGEIIEVLLDAGAPIENVPKSLDNDGQDVKEIIEQGDHFKIVVEKVV